MLKMPDEMTAEELEKFEELMFEADEIIARRKEERDRRSEPISDSIERELFNL